MDAWRILSTKSKGDLRPGCELSLLVLTQEGQPAEKVIRRIAKGKNHASRREMLAQERALRCRARRVSVSE